MNKIDFFNLMGYIINLGIVVYVLSKLIKKEIDYKKYNFYLYSIILLILTIANSFAINNYFKIIVSTILISIYSMLVFKISFKKSIVVVVVEQIIMFIPELIITTLFLSFFRDHISFFTDNSYGVFIVNIIISFFAIIIINIPIVKKRCYKVIDNSFNVGNNINVFLLLVTLNILLAFMYIETMNHNVLIINILFIVVYCYIFYFALNEKNKNIIFKAENDALMDNLSDYEKMLDYQRVANHENKNQLLAIKNIAGSKNKKLIEYINEIIADQKVDNEILLSQAKKIPSGGLQGIVYQKMLVMEDNKIKFSLESSKYIREFNFDNINSKLNYDICRIVGIFLDNAIDETIKIENKKIYTSIYKEDDCLIISISNYFDKAPDMEKISIKRYTTKGEGHGYGLALVKEIIKDNSDLNNETIIIKKMFVQKLKIKM